MKRFIGRTLFLFCTVISFDVLAQQTPNNAETSITDDQGRIRYIIDFTKDATQGQPAQINAGEPLNDDLPEWHKPEMRHFAKGIAKQFAITPVSITSWVGNSITAYLTPGQVEALKNDNRVTLITQDKYLEFSGWSDSVLKGETRSWGTTAVNGGNPINHTGTGINVYVLDAGVGYHTDLGGYNSTQVQRYNPAGYNPVGCYAHATHVAGIIGAQVNNSATRGVNPGVPIISVSTGDRLLGGLSCSDSDLSVTSIARGIDMIVQLIIHSGSSKPGIVNISINDPYATSEATNIFSYGTTLGYKLQALITPYGGFNYYYPGAFVAQSAGNQHADACFHAFDGFLGRGADPSDGFMVVGGIDNSGAPVNGPFVEPDVRYNEPGSNFGRCVDVWAPAQKIWSTWGGSAYPAMNQLSTVVYSNISSLSGTSMAAPHIAGLASYLAETQNLTTPAQIETAVRTHFRFFGYYDYQSFPIYVPIL